MARLTRARLRRAFRRESIGVDVSVCVRPRRRVLLYLCLAYLFPAVVALLYSESPWPFVVAGLVTAAFGVFLQLGATVESSRASARASSSSPLTWLLVPVFGALPYVIAGEGRAEPPARRVLRVDVGVHDDRGDRGQRLRRALRTRSGCGGSSRSGSAAWGSSCSRSRSSRGCASAAASCSSRRCRARRARAADRLDPRGRTSPLDPLRRADRDPDRAPRARSAGLGLDDRAWTSSTRRACVHDGLARAASPRRRDSDRRVRFAASQWTIAIFMVIAGVELRVRLFRVFVQRQPRAVTRDDEFRLYLVSCSSRRAVLLLELVAEATYLPGRCDPPRGLPGRLDHDDHRLRDRGLQRVGPLLALVTLIGLDVHRWLGRLDGGVDQGRPSPADRPGPPPRARADRAPRDGLRRSG